MTESSHNFWDNQAVMVTGGAGFLDSHLVEDLKSRSSDIDIFIPRSSEYDLREKADIRRAFEVSNADIVIHLAATVGGIGANQENPGRYFYDNAVMGIELIEQARQYNVKNSQFWGLFVLIPNMLRYLSNSRTSLTATLRRQTLHMGLQKNRYSHNLVHTDNSGNLIASIYFP